MIFFTVCIYTETAIFTMTNVITAIATKKYVFNPLHTLHLDCASNLISFKQSSFFFSSYS